MIRAEGLEFGYGPVPVVSGIDLEISPAELVAVWGPNGAGKSTLLRLLAGLRRPRAGSVQLLGRPLRAYPRRELARMLAYVPQETRVDFPFTVTEVVLMGRAPHVGRFRLEGDSDLAAAHEAMEALDLLPLCDRRVDEISGGELQRTALARALCQDARVLLLDEPTASLDIRHQVEVYRLLAERCRREGRAAVCVSHDLNLSARFATRVAVVKEGRLVTCAPTEDVLREELLSEVFETPVELVPGREGRPPLVAFR